MALATFFSALLVSSLAGAASAQGRSYSANVQNKCTGDANRLCPQHPLGSSEMHYCMEAKVRSISKDCMVALEDEGYMPRNTRKSDARR